MWPDWLKSPSRVHSQSPRTRFSCSSFKDIQNLITEETQPDPDDSVSSPKRSIFHRVRISTSVLKTWTHLHRPKLPTSQNDQTHITLYFTSLRIVRRTFEDCRTVRSILRGFRVPIDERDLSMDSQYIEELQSVFGSKKLNLPVVFIGGAYIGGAEKVKELHESGELTRMISGLLCKAGESNCNNGGCEICGGLRFVVCEECSGSHKIYIEKHGFRSCSSCNANGLVRCLSCSRRRLLSS